MNHDIDSNEQPDQQDSDSFLYNKLLEREEKKQANELNKPFYL